MLKVFTFGTVLAVVALSLVCRPGLASAEPASPAAPNGVIVLEAENAELADGWVRRDGENPDDPSMAGSTGRGWIEWTGPFNGGVTKQDHEVSGTLTYTFTVTRPGLYTFRWRTKQYGDVERVDAGNDSYVKFVTGTPQEMPERDGRGRYTIGQHTKVFVQSKARWSYNAAFEVAHHRFVMNPQVHYDAGVHTIQISGRSPGHAIDRLTLHHADVPFDHDTFVNYPETTTAQSSNK
ncbi:MAG: hypothetical protein AAGH99_15160 [Planctomycetota bacterium]